MYQIEPKSVDNHRGCLKDIEVPFVKSQSRLWHLFSWSTSTKMWISNWLIPLLFGTKVSQLIGALSSQDACAELREGDKKNQEVRRVCAGQRTTSEGRDGWWISLEATSHPYPFRDSPFQPPELNGSLSTLLAIKLLLFAIPPFSHWSLFVLYLPYLLYWSRIKRKEDELGTVKVRKTTIWQSSNSFTVPST